MPLSLTFAWVIGDAVTIVSTSTLGVVLGLAVDELNNKVYIVQYTDPVTGTVQQNKFFESALV
jgi:hypothetical protein